MLFLQILVNILYLYNYGKNKEIRLREYGLEEIQVIDNGCGIDPRDYSNLGK